MTDTRYQQLLAQTAGPYQAFLYDCDGTLADNMQLHKDAYVKAATHHGIDLDTAIIDELAGLPTINVVAEINKRYGTAIDAPAFGTLKSRIFADEFQQHTQPIPFVVDHLKAHAGKIKIGVVSGGSRSTVMRTLQALGIENLIDVLVCAGETPRGKPFPDPFLRAAELLSAPPATCIVFEDGNAGTQAADAAGMKWIRVDKITA